MHRECKGEAKTLSCEFNISTWVKTYSEATWLWVSDHNQEALSQSVHTWCCVLTCTLSDHRSGSGCRMDVDTRFEQVHIQAHNGTNTHTNLWHRQPAAANVWTVHRLFLVKIFRIMSEHILREHPVDTLHEISFMEFHLLFLAFFREHIVDCNGRCWVVPWELSTWVIYYVTLHDSPCS